MKRPVDKFLTGNGGHATAVSAIIAGKEERRIVNESGRQNTEFEKKARPFSGGACRQAGSFQTGGFQMGKRAKHAGYRENYTDERIF